MVDDLGKGLLPAHDRGLDINTPNIDRLAAAGVVFDNAWATPLCLTTRAELLTGRYPMHNGIAGHAERFEHVFLDPRRLPSFAVPLRRAGYATALAGKWHGMGKYQDHYALRAFGFERWMFIANQLATGANTHAGRVSFEPSAFPADRIGDFVVDFIGENRSRPFFFYYPMDLIHKPLVATPDRPDAATDTEKLVAMLEYADKMVGRLLDALDAHGLWDNTVVFFSGDNGFASVGKTELTEAGINVPLIVGGGPVTPRGRTAALTDFTDMLPTLAALAGAPVPDDYAPDGVSIADFLLGQADDTPRQWIASAAAVEPTRGLWRNMPRSSVCVSSCNVAPVRGLDRWYWREEAIGVVVRDKRFKLWHHGNGLRALFDLRADPDESVNLWDSEDPSATAARRRLLAARRTLAEGAVHVQADQQGLVSHWRLDRPLVGAAGRSVLADWVGGHHAEADAPPQIVPGKFRHAVRSESLWATTFRGNPGERSGVLSNHTLSAWVRMDRMDPGVQGEANLLRLFNARDERRGRIALAVTADGRKMAARHWHRGMNAPIPGKGWVHVAFTWEPVDDGQEAVLYLQGKARARSRELIPASIQRLALRADGGLEIGGAGMTVDDVAVWGEPLAPAQIEALHLLGHEYGYTAADADALFRVPRDYPVQVKGRRWARFASAADDGALRVEETPEGVMEIHFGNGIAVRSQLPAAGAATESAW